MTAADAGPRDGGGPFAPADAGPGPSAQAASELRPSGRRLAGALAVAVATAAGAGFVTASGARAWAPEWARDADHLAALVIAVVYAAVIASLFAVLGRTPARRRAHLGLRPTSPRALIVGLSTWTGAYVVAAVVYVALTPFGISLRDAGDLALSVGADNGRLHGASATVTSIILIRYLVLSPVMEELVFRGALYTWLRTRLSAGVTVALTGTGFGLVHQSPVFLPLAITVGLAAGWIRERTGSVAVTIAVHAAQNLAFLLVSLVATGWDTPALLG